MMAEASVPLAEQPTEKIRLTIIRNCVANYSGKGPCFFARADVALLLRLLDERDATLQQHERAISGRDDLQRTFDLQWAADQLAIKRWQEAHLGNDLVWPDRANMVVWLMEQHDAATCVLEDEQAAHQDTLRLWQEAKQQHQRAMAALREAIHWIEQNARENVGRQVILVSLRATLDDAAAAGKEETG